MPEEFEDEVMDAKQFHDEMGIDLPGEQDYDGSH